MTAHHQLRPGDSGELAFRVETLRLLGYGAFWITTITGIVVTQLFADHDVHHGIIKEVWGYNNICIYFDHPPATFVLPTLWGCTLVLLIFYLVAAWLRMRAEVLAGTLKPHLYRILSGFKLFEAFTLIAFSTSFAVSPEGWDETLYAHTIPFYLVQLGMVSLALTSTIHGIRSGYWTRLEIPRWFTDVMVVYCFVFCVVVIFKIPASANSLMGSPWWEQSPGFIQLAHFMDIMFLICAAIVPMWKAAFLLWKRGDRVELVHLTARVT